MRTNDVDLQDLNIAVQSWFEFHINDQVYNIPIYVHIKDINDYDEKNIPYKMDILRTDFRLNLTDNPFNDYYLRYNLLKEMDYYFQFIDRRKLFKDENGKYVDFFTYIGFDLREEIDEGTFIGLRNEIQYYINYTKIQFIEKCKLLFDFDREFPEHYKAEDSKMPEDVKENMAYPLGMTMVQGSIEYPSNVIFPENIGKSVVEHSFREIQLKAMYIHMKNKIESFSNNYQSWRIEKDSKPKTK
jgi:hypothetical protein